MSKNVGFRAWFYFRQGWSTYFAFIFAATNTLTVTYYLAIENYPSLKSIFPSFEQYIIIVVLVGIPLLIGIGYAHYKKTPSYRAEADVWMESNPYWARVLINSQFSLTLNLKMINLITKISNNEKITDKELDELRNLQKQFEDHINERSLSNKKDQKKFLDTEKL
jgi:hypothetical protein